MNGENNMNPVPAEEKSWKEKMETIKDQIKALDDSNSDGSFCAGELLIEAKSIYKGHGNWTKWIENNLPFSVRQAQRRIRAAEFRTKHATLVSPMNLSSSQLWVLSRLADADVKTFLHNPHNTAQSGEEDMKKVEDMTKRELERAVNLHLKSKRPSVGGTAPNSTTQIQEVEGEGGGETAHANFEALKQAMNRTIASIKEASEEERDAWISTLEVFCSESMEQLAFTQE